MSTKKFISVDWSKMANNYDSTFGTKTATGLRAPSVGGVYAWFVDFVTANFQRKSALITSYTVVWGVALI
jgi:FUN14 domain-containing protein 1